MCCECGIMIRVRHDQETILFKLQNSLRRLVFDNEIFEFILLFKCMEATGIFVSKNGCFSLVVFIAVIFQILSNFSPCSMFSGKIYLSATVYTVHGILQ